MLLHLRSTHQKTRPRNGDLFLFIESNAHLFNAPRCVNYKLNISFSYHNLSNLMAIWKKVFIKLLFQCKIFIFSDCFTCCEAILELFHPVKSSLIIIILLIWLFYWFFLFAVRWHSYSSATWQCGPSVLSKPVVPMPTLPSSITTEFGHGLSSPTSPCPSPSSTDSMWLFVCVRSGRGPISSSTTSSKHRSMDVWDLYCWKEWWSWGAIRKDCVCFIGQRKSGCA